MGHTTNSQHDNNTRNAFALYVLGMVCIAFGLSSALCAILATHAMPVSSNPTFYLIAALASLGALAGVTMVSNTRDTVMTLLKEADQAN